MECPRVCSWQPSSNYLRNKACSPFWHINKDHFVTRPLEQQLSSKNDGVVERLVSFSPMGYGPWTSSCASNRYLEGRDFGLSKPWEAVSA